MMTREECKTALKAHIMAERARDIEAIMASLHDDPFYIIPGFELRGKPAIRAMYEMSMPALTPENADEYLAALDDPTVATWGDEHVVLTYTSAYPIHYGMCVVAILADGKVKSEHSYFFREPMSPTSAFAGIEGATPVTPPPSA